MVYVGAVLFGLTLTLPLRRSGAWFRDSMNTANGQRIRAPGFIYATATFANKRGLPFGWLVGVVLAATGFDGTGCSGCGSGSIYPPHGYATAVLVAGGILIIALIPYDLTAEKYDR